MAFSPEGGTTSLPQFLQKRAAKTQPTGPTPPPATLRPLQQSANVQTGINPQQQQLTSGRTPVPAPAPAPSPGLVGRQPIPPAPPPPPVPAPTGLQPGGQIITRTADPGATVDQGFGLPDLIRRMLSGEGRYDNETIEALRTASRNRLEDERRLATDRLTANAASRGLLRSSGLSTSLGDVEERFIRQLADSEADVNRQVADARQQDLISAIQAAQGFGQGELQNQAQEQNFLLALAQLGLLGGPTIPGAVGSFGDLPFPQTGNSNDFYQYLGTLFNRPAATS